MRGTSQLEGFHHHLADMVAGWTCNPELMDVVIMEFVHRWNIKARVKNCGHRHYGFYDLELLDYLVPLEKDIWGKTSCPEWKLTGQLDISTQEKFGCGVEIPVDIMEHSQDFIELVIQGVGDSGRQNAEDDNGMVDDAHMDACVTGIGEDKPEHTKAMEECCRKHFGCGLADVSTARRPQGNSPNHAYIRCSN